MSPTKYGIALIGAGAVVSARHAPAIAATGRGEIRAIFDPDQQRASGLAAAFAIPLVADSLAEAVSAAGVDAVLVASPNSFHREGAEAAFAAGKHVLCEKPLALSLSDAQAMRNAAQAAQRVLFTGFHQRFSAEHLCVKRLLEARTIGTVRAFHSVVSEPIDVVPGGAANYRFNVKQGGGLTLIDLGSHRIDQIRKLLGGITEVYADMASVLPGHDMDDSVSLTLRLASGAIGTLAFHRFSRAYFSPCTLIGDRSMLGFSAVVRNPYQAAPVAVYVEDAPERVLPPDVLAWTRPDGWWGESRPGWVELWPPRLDTFVIQWQAFFDAIESHKPPAIDGQDGYKALEAVLAAYLSLHERRPVRLPLDPAIGIPPPHFPA